MRALVEKGGKWVAETPGDLSKWLRQHDGESAVVVDDATGTYYCGTVAHCEEYREKGKNSKMFVDLDRQLFEQEQTSGSHS